MHLNPRRAALRIVLPVGLALIAGAGPAPWADSGADRGGSDGTAVADGPFGDPTIDRTAGALDCPAAQAPASASAPVPDWTLEPLAPAGDRVQPVPTDCLVSATAAAARQAQGALLVDLRPAAHFARQRIPGSLNIEPHSLRARGFLRTRAVVLVDAGPPLGQTQALCQALRGSGLAQVYVLVGGLPAWRAQVGALDGDPVAARELQRLDPATYFLERRLDHWVIVALDAPADRPDPLTPAAVRERLLAARTEAIASGNPRPFLLAVTDDGRGWEQFLAALGDPALAPAWFLDGGRAAFARWQRAQQAMLAYRHRLSDRPGCPVD